MSEKKSDIFQYLSSLEQKLSLRKFVRRSLKDIENYPLAKGQAHYILDFSKSTVSYQKGIEELLGYSPEEFSFKLAASYFHPDDADIVTRLMKATLMFASENDVSKNVSFSLIYRIKKKDGSFIKVFRQSNTFDVDEQGKIISNLSVISDITFLSTVSKVEWRFEAPGLDQEKFREYVTKEYKGFFSEKEKNVIQLLNQGLSSKEAAEKLQLSKHTVDTHRRKILKKAQCKNTVELINFCKHNGIIN
ncbi:MAG: PAS domain-containing protein [Bacteroidia bacterium]|nr:PAS domain-containing protein [Bacteroidia bacterium]